MTIETLFGPEVCRVKPKALRFKVIRPVYETIKIHDSAAEYLGVTKTFTSAAQVARMFDFLRQEAKEHFWAVHLDTRNRILCLEAVSVGSLSASVVHPREVFKSALLSSASAVLFVHNHPSGQLDPSPEDLEITRRLQEAGKLLGIRVLDHVILGEGYLSFADQGLI